MLFIMFITGASTNRTTEPSLNHGVKFGRLCILFVDVASRRIIAVEMFAICSVIKPALTEYAFNRAKTHNA